MNKKSIFYALSAMLLNLIFSSAWADSQTSVSPELVANCHSNRIDIVELPNDSYDLKIWKLNEHQYMAVVSDKSGVEIARFSSEANAQMLVENYLVFEQKYQNPNVPESSASESAAPNLPVSTVLTGQSISLDFGTKLAQWVQNKGCEVLISAQFACD